MVEHTKCEVGTEGWRFAFEVSCRNGGEFFVACRRLLVVLLTIWVSSAFCSGALRSVGRTWLGFDGIVDTVLCVGTKCSRVGFLPALIFFSVGSDT